MAEKKQDPKDQPAAAPAPDKKKGANKKKKKAKKRKRPKKGAKRHWKYRDLKAGEKFGPGKNIGNEWWNLRAKHGRDKLFKTPALLWEAAIECFQHTVNRPWIKKDWVGKDAYEVEREMTPPFTMSGLCLYLGCSESYFRMFKKSILDKPIKDRKGIDKDFLTVIGQIEQTMYTQKMEGASVGAFNANIISQDLGLKTRLDATTADNPIGPQIVISNEGNKISLTSPNADANELQSE